MASLFVNELTNIDFSYLDPHRGVVGESWLLDVQLYGDLDDQGMVFDFGLVKKVIRGYIDEAYDHRLWIPTNCTGCQVTDCDDDRVNVKLRLSDGSLLQHTSPKEAIQLIPETNITKAGTIKLLEQELMTLLPTNVKEIRVFLREENIDGAYYHYSHGLEKHQGNCQRIAHGHRSRIEIQVDGERCLETEAKWASEWQDIYIVTQSHIVEQFSDEGVSYFKIAYTAPQGQFEIILAKKLCQVIPYDSTVELIAKFIAETLKSQHSQSNFKVKAFEGIKKGAIAFS